MRPIGSRLRRAATSRPLVGPAFLGIGAQKAGSTWLHVNLRAHPKVWLPPVKELNYFSQVHAARGSGLLGRWFGRGPVGGRYRRLFVARALADLRARSARDLIWDLRFFLGPRHDGWYRGLFPSDGSLLAGEVSPAYATMGAAGVAHVRGMLPDARIVLILRDPIDRAWSQALMRLVKVEGHEPSRLLRPELERYATGPGPLRLGDYPAILKDWGAAYPPDRLFVGFFDDLQRDPRRFLERVQRFLGLDEPELVPPDCDRSVNPNRAIPLPPRVECRLAELNLESLRELTRLLDGPPRLWLARAETVLATRRRG